MTSPDASDPPDKPDKGDQPEQPDRREFMTKAAAVGIGAVCTLVPVAAGVVTILDPLRRKSTLGAPLLVTTLEALPNDGKPRRFQVIADREDAWNKFPHVPIGAVYLRRVDETRVEALNVTCPHAGCPVEFKPDSKSYLCPCHDSTFNLDGSLASAKSPSPRGLDTLAVEIRNNSEVWVTFQNFEAGQGTENTTRMKAVINWLDNRTGIRKILHEALFENVPGGARWRYVWGSTLTFTLMVQFITGVFLWMAYSPSSQTAWESVYHIEHQLQGGWLLRGIHHYTAHAMVVLLVLHLMQVVIDGAYKAPREVNFWFGVGLLMLVMGLGLTGYLLPWDQKGYWATKVATSISATTPGVGPEVQKLVVGGTEYGHHTLTRFFALHAGVLPGAIIVLLVGHIYLFRRHGITPKEPKRKQDAAFWPDQVFKDAVACLAVLAAVLILTLMYGAELTAPADPADNYAAARPEWYFMFLFELLKYFPGESEVWGAIILPGATVLLICLMPFIGRWKLGHWFNLGVLWALLCGAGMLTWMAYKADRSNPGFVAAAKQAHRDAVRVKELAGSPTGIPSAGAVTLLRTDPYTQGPKLFSKHCASCHRFDGHDGLGEMPTDPQSASDLKGFGSREWITGLLDPAHISGPKYFGGTKFTDGKMAKFVKKDVAGFTAAQKEQLSKVIAALSAEAGLNSQAAVETEEKALIEEGRTLFAHEDMRCAECHEFHKPDEDASAPDLTGYGSREWLTGILTNPKHERFYGSRNDRMPAFGDDKMLDAQAIGLLADWLRGYWYVAPPAR